MNATYTLKHLKYFITLAKLKHFGQAADACFVTQPTLSAAIKEFEDILGVQLFERTKRRVFITPIGEEILERAKEISMQADELMELAQSRRAPLSGELRMGIIPTIGPYLLPKLMGKIREHYPDLTLLWREDQTARLLDGLRDGQLDVLVLALPYISEGIETFTFMEDPFYCTLPKDHRLSKNKVIQNRDIVDEKLLLLEEGHCLRDHAMAACSWANTQDKNEFAATSLSTIVQMVASGVGLTLLPKMAIDSGIINGSGLVTIPLDKDSPPRDIGLVWRKTSSRTEEFETLGVFLEKNLQYLYL